MASLDCLQEGTGVMADPRSVLNDCQSDPVANTETYFVQIKLAPESKLISELLSADFCKPRQGKYYHAANSPAGHG